MILIRVLMLIVLLSAATSSTFGQLQIPGFLPSVCAPSAKNGIPGASDGQIIAIASVGIEIDLGISTMFVGMNLKDGKSPMWLYLVYSPSLDTSIWVSLIRPLGSCSAPPVDIPTDGIDASAIGRTPIPSNAIEGTNVVNAVLANSEYKAFSAAHPDSLQFLTVLSVSTEQFLTFPAETPFWMLTWMDFMNPTTPFFCVVHAVTGQTICFGGDVSSVDEISGTSFTQAWPNPASDVATISIPRSAIGKPLSIQAFSPTGHRVVLIDGVYAVSEFLPVPTQELMNGVWYVRVLGAHEPTLYATAQLIIQR